MSYCEGYANEQASGLQGEVAARIADFLARKTKSVPERVEALYRLIESKVLNDGVCEGLLTLVRKFKGEVRSRTLAGSMTESDWNVLVEQIVSYRHQTSIENYTAYLFTMDGGPGLDRI